MGMILALQPASPEHVHQIRQHPLLVGLLLEQGDTEMFDMMVEEAQAPKGFLQRLFGKQPKSPVPNGAGWEVHPGEEEGTDLDKSWDLLQFCLAEGREPRPPLDFLTLGGDWLEGTDTGYGPWRLFGPEEVVAIHEVLGRLEPNQVASKLDVARMRKLDIYLADSIEPEDLPEMREYVEENLSLVQAFVRQCQAQGYGMVLGLT